MVRSSGNAVDADAWKHRSAQGAAMSTPVLKLDVSHEYVAGLAKLKKPVLGIEELIWNALDADATSVEVTFRRNAMDGLERIVVHDDGLGIDPDDKDIAFGQLGGSPKRLQGRSPSGRILHGKEGKGRFKAFGLGSRVEWRSNYRRTDGHIFGWTLAGDSSDLRLFRPGTATPSPSSSTGTTVTISNVDVSPTALTSDAARLELLTRLALYLRAYPQIRVVYNGEALDIAKVQQRTDNFEIDASLPDGTRVTGTLTVIEWTPDVERRLYLCTADGLARKEASVNIHAKGFNFTAYVKSETISVLSEAEVEVAEMDPRVVHLLDVARSRLREHFDARKQERLEEVVAGWKADGIYPYKEEPASPVARAEREVFEICAINIHQRLPGFDKVEPENKKLTMRLLRQALETSPSSVQMILREVLNLPRHHQDELAELLQRTKLASIIRAAKVVSDRLTFVQSLEMLLFDKGYRNRLLERSQLQRILVNELWIFGEQYELGLDDKSLKTLLENHARILGRSVLAEEVKDINGDEAIPDLMLYRRYADRTYGRYEHLVVELKRPKRDLNADDISQIEKYAYAIAEDPRFDKGNTKWTFVLIGDDLAPFAKSRCEQHDRPFGLIDQKPNLDIWVKKWATIIQDCKWRHEFYRSELDLEVQTDDAAMYLERKYAQYMPRVAKVAAEAASAHPQAEAANAPAVAKTVKGKTKKRGTPSASA